MKNITYLDGHPFVPYVREVYDEVEMLDRVVRFNSFMNERRTVRDFSDRTVSKEIIGEIIMAASSAPSGANKQPWTFCAVSNSEIKSEIRKQAEQEEKINYSGRMSETWLKDLAHLGTNEQKPFLEIAPWLIVVFKRAYEFGEDGEKRNNYYVQESVGLACGMLLAAIHNAGLVALTHTPSPMNFLCEVLKRPENERPFLLIPVGYAAEDALVPDISRKLPEEVIYWY
jgi:iodotyrosine deiodinase